MARNMPPVAEASPAVDQATLQAGWFFENAEDLFVAIRPADRCILAVNPAWETVTGWSCAELVGRNLFELVADDDVEGLRQFGLQLAGKGRAITTFRLRHKSGQWLWLEGYARQGASGEIMGMLRDVTEEREQRARLDQADQLRFLLSQTAGVGPWRYDPRDNQLTWSQEILTLLSRLGVQFSDSEGFFEQCHPDDAQVVDQAMDKVVADGQPLCFDHRLRGTDGRWAHLRVNVRGEEIEPGVHMVHGLSQDITELAEAREAAVLAEKQSRRLIEQAPFAVALFDRRLAYAMASPRWIEFFRMEGQPFMGKRLDEVSPTAYADFVRQQELALQGQVSRGSEQRLVDSRGNVYWLRWEMRPWREASGEITGVVLYADDVSDISLARREAQDHEQRLKIALGAARAAVIETDHKAWAVWSSPELVALTGHDLTGPASQNIWPFIHPDDAQRVTEVVSSWYAGAPVEPMETRILTPTGQERWVRIYTEFEWDPDGAPIRSVNLLIDIDERKRQELALVEAQREAQAAAEAKAQFLANMSHEIRTPMNGILGVLHLLEHQSLPEEARSMLGEALACGRMLQAILDDVVDFSRIEAGRLELADEALDPAAMVDGVVRLLKPQAEAKGLAISVETDGLPARIWGDPVRLRQCLFNLIGNAVKFTQAGTIVVRATARDGRLRFEVQDTGIGIDREAQARLFQRFQQADATTTRRFGGSGLGLAITSRLAELMGGAVGVSSAAGVGSTFWLEIPERVGGAAPVVEAELAGVLDGLRVLVVEDNATNRMIASKILESLGAAAVETADDGEAGVAAAARGGFDLILMDIQMPGIDGVEATRRIRALGGPVATTPVVALTANVLNHQRDTYLAAGMDGVVGKPISPVALLAEIARLAAAEPMTEAAARATSARS